MEISIKIKEIAEGRKGIEKILQKKTVSTREIYSCLIKDAANNIKSKNRDLERDLQDEVRCMFQK